MKIGEGEKEKPFQIAKKWETDIVSECRKKLCIKDEEKEGRPLPPQSLRALRFKSLTTRRRLEKEEFIKETIVLFSEKGDVRLPECGVPGRIIDLFSCARGGDMREGKKKALTISHHDWCRRKGTFLMIPVRKESLPSIVCTLKAKSEKGGDGLIL